jgi:hypothetical protein
MNGDISNLPETPPIEQSFPSGVLPDARTPRQKAKDFSIEELFAAPPPLVWTDWNNWRAELVNKTLLDLISIQNQDGSYSCVAQSGSLALAINNWLEEKHYERMSARSIYPYRRNKPSQGMWLDDLGNIVTQKGVLFEGILPSEGMDEQKMNDLTDYLPSYENISKIYRNKDYIFLSSNIDVIAGILAQVKPVVITVLFGNGEWAKDVPVIIEGNPTPYGHAVTALPNAYFTYGGEKAILIQDSWGVNTGMNGRRIITENWFKDRVQQAIWFEDLQNLALQNDTLAKPIYHFTRNLTTGAKGNDVAMLQRCLGYLKDADGYLFPLNIEPTGFYGGITRNAVKKFQKLYALTQTGSVDKVTRALLNTLFK